MPVAVVLQNAMTKKGDRGGIVKVVVRRRRFLSSSVSKRTYSQSQDSLAKAMGKSWRASSLWRKTKATGYQRGENAAATLFFF